MAIIKRHWLKWSFLIIFIVYVSNSYAYFYKETNVCKTRACRKASKSDPSSAPINDGYCRTNMCKEAGSAILKNMDQSVKPCDNFYEFACGKFLEKTALPEGDLEVSLFTILTAKIDQQLKRSIEAIPEFTEQIWERRLKSFYESCMNGAEASNDDLKEKLSKFGGWPVLEGKSWNVTIDWQHLIRELNLMGFNFDAFIHLKKSKDKIENKINAIVLEQPNFGLDHAFLSQGWDSPVVEDYFKYMVNVATILGAKRNEAEEELRDSMDFEISLAKMSLPIHERLNDSKLWEEITMTELDEKYQVLSTFIHTKVAPNEISRGAVVRAERNYIDGFTELLEKYPKRTLFNYAIWCAINSIADKLNYFVRSIQRKFYWTIGKMPQHMERSVECVKDAKFYMPEAVNAIYAQRFADKEVKKAVELMAKNISDSFELTIEDMDWLAEDIKVKAMDQHANMRALIGYTEEFFDDKKLNEYHKRLDLNTTNYLDTVLKTNLFQRTANPRENLRSEVDEGIRVTCTEYACDVSTVSASYEPDFNTFYVSLGYMNKPLYHKRYPQYVNYGNLGTIIGHEIAHSFDLDILLEDETSKDEFSQRIRCFIDKYHEESIENLEYNLTSKNSFFENLADNIGLRQAYLTYVEHFPNEAVRLPGKLKDFTPRQLFWIAYAQGNCAKYDPTYLKYMLLNDEHEPEINRINIPLANLPEFAEDFNCPAGSRMNSTKKCTFW